ncbi:hypothetical protein GALMADRAFT_142734 [Galerina marginata CBS 339.88]|uniref:Uncharacterized protein n=1 Tax=Galerina marginata (strain CBS 339.88) TaxID=685588 RepID=A0A067SQ87_GALM3|nr:hypothetical protein GALMADRAFT_142734 [Galerina marginata CBS 339.88]
MADAPACFKPNPAIFGLGVRIGFYFIGILAAVTPIKSTFTTWKLKQIENGNEDVQPKREISSIVTVQGVQGLGLLVTAVIQTALGQLSLYHAFLIINLLFLLSTLFLYFLFSPGISLRRRWFFLFALLLLSIFSLYVGLHASSFGSQPDCNHTVQIIWIFRVTTASFVWFRNFGITIFSVYLGVALLHIAQLFLFKRTTTDLGSTPLRAYGLTVLLINFVLIGVIEETIRVNNVPDNTLWSFGQVLPIVMLIGPVFDIWDDNFPLLKAAWLKRRGARSYSKLDY